MGYKQEALGEKPEHIRVPRALYDEVNEFRSSRRMPTSFSAALRFLVGKGLDALKDPCPNCGGGDPIHARNRQSANSNDQPCPLNADNQVKDD